MSASDRLALFRAVCRADPAPDAELLDRFRSGRDEAAFATLVERHGPMVLGACRRALGDHHAAEDAFQATFFALARSVDRVRKAGSLAAWLYGAAVRVARTARRSAARAPDPARLADRGPADPLAETTGRELVAVIDAELTRLPDPVRAAVVLCCLEGLTVNEAAHGLGWTAGSVKGRLERGRDRLRRRLARRGIATPAAFAAALLATPSQAVPARLVARAVDAATAVAAPPAVAALAAAAAPAGPLPKLAAVALLALACGGLAGLGDPPAPAAVDRFGDPLLEGAVLRLDTTRHAHVFAGAFAADNSLRAVWPDKIPSDDFLPIQGCDRDAQPQFRARASTCCSADRQGKAKRNFLRPEPSVCCRELIG
ncbi:MAG: RNA polymerase sigma factor [Gemmataceae bacterium]